MRTRKDVVEDISFDLAVIIRKFENDVATLKQLQTNLDEWASETFFTNEYQGGLEHRISDVLLGLTNNSGWISYVGAAIRKAGK